MKIKRNQSCPCGSGKKYKKCCLTKQNLVPAGDLNYRRLSKAYEDLEIKLEKFFYDQCGEYGLGEGLDEFYCWPEDNDVDYIENAFDRLQDLYRPWLLYDWEYDEDAEVPEGMLSNSISLAYLEKNAKKISEIERKLILAISQKPYCFWEITAVTPGREMTVKNIITGKLITVIEKMLTTQINPKDIIFTRAVMVDGTGILVGSGRTLVPHSIKPTLIELRKSIRGDQLFITDEDIADWDMDLRQLYLDIDHHVHTPPKLQNSDGEAMEPHKLVYAIDDPEKVFKKLATLCMVESEKNLRAEAETDENRCVLKVNFSWTKKGNRQMPEWDNTILGEIQITQERLTIHVNSAERAKKIQKEIKKRLKKLARFQLDVIEDMDGIMAKMIKKPDQFGKAGLDHDELIQIPEVRDGLEKNVLNHWESWTDIPLPVLGDETPKNAVKDSDGKEAVESLLYDAITSTPDPLIQEMNVKGVTHICKELGLNFPK